MARYYGKIGYASPGSLVDDVWTASIVERDHFGVVLQSVRYLDPSDKVNDDIRLQNRLSIMADAYALENYAFIKYASWNGSLWIVTSVEVQRPRLILSLGGVYDGESATP